ncbi:MAG: phage terminase large subunit [Planctomycetes bacterium]|nr:phage terminase large subunit [Planctomycetota bacterium]
MDTLTKASRCPGNRDDPRLRLLYESIFRNPYIPLKPTAKQALFLLDGRREVLFGGSVGPGKSSSLLMAALMFAEIPGYAALLLRRTYSDLALPGALMAKAAEWLTGTGATWSEPEKTWTFPSGATLTFGYLDSKSDHLRYQSSEFAFIGFDELATFEEEQYRFLFSRLRRLAGSPLPLRMRSASNPSGPGVEWVRRRFLDSTDPDRGFIRAGLADNPHLDQVAYKASLAHLDPLTRRRLLEGDWTARAEGSLFRREWFAIEDAAPGELALVRWWDLSAGGDYSVGLKLGRDALNRYHVLHVVRVQLPPAEVEAVVKRTAEADGVEVLQLFGEEPGSAGKALVDHYRRNVVPFARVEGVRETGPKYVRAQPVAGQAANGNVSLLRGAWNEPLLDELEAFGEDPRTYSHDDQVDALAGAYGYLAARGLRAPAPVRLADAFAFGAPRDGFESFLASRRGGFFG